MSDIYEINGQILLKIINPQTIALQYTCEGKEKNALNTFTADIPYYDLEKLLHEIEKFEYVSWITQDKNLTIRGQVYKLELLFAMDEPPFECRRNLTMDESIKFKNIIKGILAMY